MTLGEAAVSTSINAVATSIKSFDYRADLAFNIRLKSEQDKKGFQDYLDQNLKYPYQISQYYGSDRLKATVYVSHLETHRLSFEGLLYSEPAAILSPTIFGATTRIIKEGEAFGVLFNFPMVRAEPAVCGYYPSPMWGEFVIRGIEMENVSIVDGKTHFEYWAFPSCNYPKEWVQFDFNRGIAVLSDASISARVIELDPIVEIGTVKNNTIDAPRGIRISFGSSKLDFILIDSSSDHTSTIANYGTLDNDFLTLAPNEISLYGLQGNDTLVGNASDNLIFGGSSSDTLAGEGGNDTLDGGDGADTALYSGQSQDYKVTKQSNSAWQVTDQRAFAQAVGRPHGDGIDQLSNVERLKFSDKSLAIDLDGNAGTTAKILGAVFGKAAVANGVYAGIGLHYLDNLGYSYQQLMGVAINAALGPTPTNDQVVDLLYKNVVGVLPDAATRAMLVGMLDRKEHTISSLGVLAAETDLNKSTIDLVGLVKTGLEYLPFQS